MKTAQRIQSLPEYVFSKLANKIVEVEETSKRKVLNLGAGDPDIRPSTLYLEKFAEFIRDDDSHRYPGYGAGKEFSQALIYWYEKRFGVALENDELLPLLGAKDGVAHLPQVLLNEGDEVLIPDPGYPGFTGASVLVGARPVYYSLREENNFKIDFEELERQLSPRTKIFWVNFPSNPTGQVATLTALEKVVEFAQEHNLIVVYDNAYSEITFDGFRAPSILQVQGAKECAVEIGSFSKTFSFAGFRMGWIVGNKNIITALARLKSNIDSGMSLPLQKLGAFALTNFDEVWHKEMIATYTSRREVIHSCIKSLGLQCGLPSGGLYLWAKIPDTEENSVTFCEELLLERQILVTPGTVFGKNGERFVRISICVDTDRIHDYFNNEN